MKLFYLLIAGLFLYACSASEQDKKTDSYSLESGVKNEDGFVKVNSSLEYEIPTLLEKSNWLADLTHQGNILYSGDFKIQDMISVAQGEEFETVLIPEPVIIGDYIFMMDSHANISAHDRNDIETVIWESDAIAHEEAIGGSLMFYEGRIYAGNGRGLLGVINAVDGKLIWRRDFDMSLRSTPVVKNSVIVMISSDNQTLAINAQNGNILWSHIGASTGVTLLRKNIAPAVNGNIVFIPYGSGRIYALSLIDGSEIWSGNLLKNRQNSSNPRISGISTTPFTIGNIVVAGGNEGYFTASEINFGGTIWENDISVVNTPWRAGDALFVITDKNQLAAIEITTGNGIWVAELPLQKREEDEHPESFTSPIMINNNVYVLNDLGEMFEFDGLTGRLKNTITVPKQVYTKPAIVAGSMYIIDKEANLYLLK